MTINFEDLILNKVRCPRRISLFVDNDTLAISQR